MNGKNDARNARGVVESTLSAAVTHFGALVVGAREKFSSGAPPILSSLLQTRTVFLSII